MTPRGIQCVLACLPCPPPLFALCEVSDSVRRFLFDGFLLSFIGVDEQALVWKVLVGRG